MQIRQRIFKCTDILDKIKDTVLHGFLSLVIAKLSQLRNSPGFLAHFVCSGRVDATDAGSAQVHTHKTHRL